MQASKNEGKGPPFFDSIRGLPYLQPSTTKGEPEIQWLQLYVQLATDSIQSLTSDKRTGYVS